MILWALIFALLYSLLSSGAPVGTTPPNDNNEPVFLTNYRSTVQIIWTCLTIVFASTWVCIHPHVYGYKSTLLQRIGRRIRLFSNALLFPERFVQRAFDQWMGYRRLYKDMQKCAKGLDIPLVLPSGAPLWTPVHAHFIQMGGVVFRNSYRSVERMESSSKERCGANVNVSDTDISILEDKLGGGDGQERQGSTYPDSDSETATIGISAADEDSNSMATFRTADGDNTNVPPDVISYKDVGEWEEADVRAFFELKLTQEQVEDRSKADGLAKAFVVIQCFWFIVQCTGRGVYGLPLLELEVTCLAFIACNIGMYCFWWKKPMNIVCPVEIHQPSSERLNATTVRLGEGTTQGVQNRSSGWVMAVVYTLQTGDIGYLTSPESGDFEYKQIESTSILYPANYMYSRTGHKNDQTLYEEWGTWTWVAYWLAPAVFGALHSIGWYASFPSATEQLLWRSSCVIPAVHALLYIFWTLGHISSKSTPSSWPRIVRRIYRVIAADTLNVLYSFISSPVNFAARFVFIVLPLLQLRNLPPLAHQTVPWSDFLPHV
ncbi:hypothetical protein NMY22_g5172 [Coprinellus aureogranulatus]|nr:hypothetical protein NMY22_g5172 [Coprinellus aureogranulatus]